MTNILVDKAAIEQALEALETLNSGDSYKTHNAAAALREQLAKQPEQEPVATMEVFSGWGDEANFEQLPFDLPDGVYKLYSAPVRTKDLTDDEIWDALASIGFGTSCYEDARAVIAADREKNK